MDKLCSTVGGTGTVEADKCQKVVGCGHRNKRSESHAKHQLRTVAHPNASGVFKAT